MGEAAGYGHTKISRENLTSELKHDPAGRLVFGAADFPRPRVSPKISREIFPTEYHT